MQNLLKMPKPTLFDYLIPGLINIRSKRFISTGIILVFVDVISIFSFFTNPSDSPVFIYFVLIWTYLLNYFVCRFQANGDNFIPNFISQAILFYFYILNLIFVSVSIVTNPITEVLINGDLNIVRSFLWIFILLPFFSFFYYLEMCYAGFALKDFAAENVRSNYIESSATGVYSVKFINKVGFPLFTFVFIGIKIGDFLTNKKFGSFLRDLNRGKKERSVKNSLIAAFAINFAYIFLSIISGILLTFVYFLKI